MAETSPAEEPVQPEAEELAPSDGASASSPRGRGRRLRRGALLLVVLLAGVGVLAASSVVGYRIPTGSMAPTLLGDHFQVACASCGGVYLVGRRSIELGPNAPSALDLNSECPLCSYAQQTTMSRSDVIAGTQVGVNRYAYLVGDPRHFEKVAYRQPGQGNRTYLHRVVGLPGDTLRIQNGDLFLVEGGVAAHLRPSDEEQDALWCLLHDGALPARNHAGPWWTPEVSGSTTWSVLPSDPEHDAAKLECTPADATPDWLRYEGELDTRLSFNRSDPMSPRPEPTADLRVRVRASGESGAEVQLAIRETYSEGGRQTRVVSASFPIGTGRGRFAVLVDGEEQTRCEAERLAPGRVHDLTFAYANDRLRVFARDQLLLTWEDVSGPSETLRGEVLLAVAHKQASFERPRIERDALHYVRGSGYSKTDPSAQDLTIPPGAFFLLGDNSANSLDSRTLGFVPRENLVGPVVYTFR